MKCVGGIAPLYGPSFFPESALKVDKIAKQLWLQVYRKAGRMSICVPERELFNICSNWRPFQKAGFTRCTEQLIQYSEEQLATPPTSGATEPHHACLKADNTAIQSITIPISAAHSK